MAAALPVFQLPHRGWVPLSHCSSQSGWDSKASVHGGAAGKPHWCIWITMVVAGYWWLIWKMPAVYEGFSKLGTPKMEGLLLSMIPVGWFGDPLFWETHLWLIIDFRGIVWCYWSITGQPNIATIDQWYMVVVTVDCGCCWLITGVYSG